jgi:hypothetical protein
LKAWKLVFSVNQGKKGPGSEGQERLGIRESPARITHAVYIDEDKTVCNVRFDTEEFPNKSAGHFPNCGNCYTTLVRKAKWEYKQGKKDR